AAGLREHLARASRERGRGTERRTDALGTARDPRHAAIPGLDEMSDEHARFAMSTFDTPEPITVELDLGAANVDIRASDRIDTVADVQPTNRASKSDVAAAEQTTVEYRDGMLRIASPKGWRQWLPWGGRVSVDVRIELPSGSHVRGASGVVGLRTTGRIGECRFKTGAGNMRVDEGGPVALTAGAGDIEVSGATGAVDAKTSSGSVRIGAVDGTVVV